MRADSVYNEAMRRFARALGAFVRVPFATDRGAPRRPFKQSLHAIQGLREGSKMKIKSMLLILFLLGAAHSLPLQAREVEPNETPETASQLINENVGQTQSLYEVGDLIRRVDNGVPVFPSPPAFYAIQDDYDFYYFDAQIAGIIPVTFSCNAAVGDGVWQVDVIDRDGITSQSGYGIDYTQCRDTISGGFRFEINAIALGRYYILVRGPLWRPAPPTETTVTVGGVQTTRVDTTIASRGGTISLSDYRLKVDASYRPIPLTTTVTGQISSLLDADFYSVHADETGRIPIAFSCNNSINSAAPGDWIIQTYNPNRYLLSSYPVNFSQCREEAVGGAGAFLFDIVASGAGDYLIEVRGPDNITGSTASGALDNSDYQLKILDVNPQTQQFQEFQDALKIRKYVSEQISSYTNKDYFYVEAKRKSNIPMAFACNRSLGGNWTIQVYDGAFNLQSNYPVSTQQCCGGVNGNSCSKRNIFNFNVKAQAAGKYYVVVGGPNYTVTGGVLTPVSGTLDQSNYLLGKSAYLVRPQVSNSTSTPPNTASGP
jgi:hypothetical protein